MAGSHPSEDAGPDAGGAAGRAAAGGAGGSGGSGSGGSGGEFRASRALGRAVLLTGLLGIGAVVLGRVDLVLLAAPFAIGAAWALRRRPDRVPEVSVSVAAADRSAAMVEGGSVTGLATVANTSARALDVVVVRVASSRWLALAGTRAPYAVAVPPHRAADLSVTGTARRWGRHRLGPVGLTAFACDGLLFAHQPAPVAARVVAYPATEPFSAAEAVPRAGGLVGTHRSRRLGEGGELAGVRQYAPGDRLRRIDWRVSLRTRQLHVAATLSDRDAEVVLLLDLLAEVGISTGVGGRASVLDTTVRAAAAIAEHYLKLGDRVSIVEYGSQGRRLRPGSGRRQYLTVLEWLLDVRASAHLGEPPEHLLHAQVGPPHALIVVLTPLVEPRTAETLAWLVRAGRFVVAVDTLPAEPGGDYPPVGYRLWRLERANTVDALREHGVPVVPWAGAGSLDRVLRDVSRVATAPRVGWT